MKIIKLIFILFLLINLSSCVTVQEVNQKFAAIDRVWLLDYQRMEESVRFRVIDAPYINVFDSVKKTTLELGVPIISANYETGVIIGETEGPTPLTQEEWLEVKRIEEPRVKEIGGMLFSIAEDASIYILTPKITLTPLKNQTLVSLDYSLASPYYESLGYRMSKTAPPSAVKLGSDKFWNSLNKKLAKLDIPEVKQGDKSKLVREAELDADVSYEPLLINQNKNSVQKKKRNKWKESVVTIKTQNGHGSGFAIYDDLVITNKHVVDELKVIKVKTSDGKEFQGDVLRKNNMRDVALIKIRNKLPTYFSLKEDLPEQGDDVFVIGSPKYDFLHSTLTKGIVSAIRVFDGLTTIQSDVTITGGNSGGPMINNEGEVIGVVQGGFKDIDTGDSLVGMNIFIPTKEALSFLNIQIEN